MSAYNAFFIITSLVVVATLVNVYCHASTSHLFLASSKLVTVALELGLTMLGLKMDLKG